MAVGAVGEQALFFARKQKQNNFAPGGDGKFSAGALGSKSFLRLIFKKKGLASSTLAVCHACTAEVPTVLNLNFGAVTAQGAGDLNQISGTAAYEAPTPHIRVKIDIENLTNLRPIFDSIGTAADGITPLYFALPGRSLFGAVSIPLN
jgi:hypothetical protein